MLDSLTTRLTGIFDRLRGFGRLTEENIQEALREVRVALLEADVNFKVVKGFIERVRVKAIGQDVLTSLTPGQQVVKIVRDELIELLGGSGHRLALASHPPTVVMLVGLQGSGKTTSAAKLARHFQKQGQHPILASADVYRPAAMEQLRRLGQELGIPVLGEESRKPVDICRAARDGLAQRILGMGDVLSLVEKAQANVDATQAAELERKIRDESLSLEDFAAQLKQLRSMGPLGQLLDMIPMFKGAKGMPKELKGEEQDLKKYEAIIGSMTPEERVKPQVINGSRRTRIAKGSGTQVSDVNRLLKQYAQLKQMMKGLKQMA